MGVVIQAFILGWPIILYSICIRAGIEDDFTTREGMCLWWAMALWWGFVGGSIAIFVLPFTK